MYCALYFVDVKIQRTYLDLVVELLVVEKD